MATAELLSPPPTLEETTVYSAAQNPPTVLGSVILKQEVSPGSPKIPPSSTDKPQRNDTENILTPGNPDKDGKSGRSRTITESKRSVKAVSPISPCNLSDTLDVTPAVNYPNRTFRPGMLEILSDDSGTDICDAVIASSNVRPATVFRVIKGQSLITKTGPYASKHFIAVKVTNIKVEKNTKYLYGMLRIRGASHKTLAWFNGRNIYARDAVNIRFPDASQPRCQVNDGRTDAETISRAIARDPEASNEVPVSNLSAPVQVETSRAGFEYSTSWKMQLPVLSGQPMVASKHQCPAWVQLRRILQS